MSPEETAIKTTYLSIVGNLGLALIKGFAGVFGNSYALIADAIESTTDVFSSFFVLLGLKYAKRPPDDNHPYGHGKIEPLITFVVVTFLVTSATIIAYESIKNIQRPHRIPEAWTLIVLSFIIIWKEACYRIVTKRNSKIQSSSLKADAWHHRSDAITSVTAFIGISIALFFGKGYETADDWAALAAAAFILYNSYLILRPALGEIMDEQRHHELVDKIRLIALQVEGIKATEKCYIRKSGLKFHVDLHAMVNGDISVTRGHQLAHNLKDTLVDEMPNIDNVHIHIEPYEQTRI